MCEIFWNLVWGIIFSLESVRQGFQPSCTYQQHFSLWLFSLTLYETFRHVFSFADIANHNICQKQNLFPSPHFICFTTCFFLKSNHNNFQANQLKYLHSVLDRDDFIAWNGMASKECRGKVSFYCTRMYPMALMCFSPLSGLCLASFPQVLESSGYPFVPKPILESQLLHSFCSLPRKPILALEQ